MAAPPPQLNAASRLQSRTATSRGSVGSLTQTITGTGTGTGTPDRTTTPDHLVLRLRGAHPLSSTTETEPHTNAAVGASNPRSRQRRIQWDENVIDNEGLGRKKSKVCCIYHKPRAVGESSDEDSSSSSSSSDSDSSDNSDNDGARPVKNISSSGGSGKKRRIRRSRRRQSSHDHDHDSTGGECNGHGRPHRRNPAHDRRPSPNAYERMPRYDVRPLVQQPRSAT